VKLKVRDVKGVLSIHLNNFLGASLPL